MTIDTPLERSATRHWIAIGRVGGALAALLAAAVIGLALAGSVSAGWMGGHGGPGFGSRGMIMDGPLDPAEVKVRVERMVGHIAVEIDATDEQKEKLTAIFVSAANDLMPIRAEIIETRQAGELIGLLTSGVELLGEFLVLGFLLALLLIGGGEGLTEFRDLEVVLLLLGGGL